MLKIAMTGLIALGLSASTGGCGKAAAKGGHPPPGVTVATPVQRSAVDWDEYTGYLQSPQSVDVRPRVGGELVTVDFDEGSLVHAGDVLVEIDPRPAQAELAVRRAAVAQAKAQVALAKVTFQRNTQAVANQAVSQTDYDTAKANYEQAQAIQASAEANVAAAQLSLEWCRVVAPITGRISSRYVTAGNLVAGGTDTGTLLTSIRSTDPMYCYVDVDERSLLKYKRLAIADGRPTSQPTDAHTTCYMGLLGEDGTPHPGRIDFVDNRVDVNTGTLRIRGVFANPAGLLTPGLYARLRVPGSGKYTAILVPDSAVGTQQNLRYLYVLGEDDKVHFAAVKLGTLFGTLRSITDGLKPTDKVVINGLVNLADGITVTPTEAKIDASGFHITGEDGPTTQPMPAIPPAETANLGTGRPPGTGGTDSPKPAPRSADGGHK